MWTRDNTLWLVLIACSVFGYLATTPDPRTWGWEQSMNAAVAVLGIVAGYLRSSPLPKGKS